MNCGIFHGVSIVYSILEYFYFMYLCLMQISIPYGAGMLPDKSNVYEVNKEIMYVSH